MVVEIKLADMGKAIPATSFICCEAKNIFLGPVSEKILVLAKTLAKSGT